MAQVLPHLTAARKSDGSNPARGIEGRNDSFPWRGLFDVLGGRDNLRAIGKNTGYQYKLFQRSQVLSWSEMSILYMG